MAQIYSWLRKKKIRYGSWHWWCGGEKFYGKCDRKVAKSARIFLKSNKQKTESKTNRPAKVESYESFDGESSSKNKGKSKKKIEGKKDHLRLIASMTWRWKIGVYQKKKKRKTGRKNYITCGWLHRWHGGGKSWRDQKKIKKRQNELPATDGIDDMEVKNLGEPPVEARQATHTKGGDRLRMENIGKHKTIFFFFKIKIAQ